MGILADSGGRWKANDIVGDGRSRVRVQVAGQRTRIADGSARAVITWLSALARGQGADKVAIPRTRSGIAVFLIGSLFRPLAAPSGWFNDAVALPR
jgi:hypothetical protein